MGMFAAKISTPFGAYGMPPYFPDPQADPRASLGRQANLAAALAAAPRLPASAPGMGVGRAPTPSVDPMDAAASGVAPPLPAAPLNMSAVPTLADGQRKPAFFGEGGTGRRIAGILGDALAGATGGQPLYANAMRQQRLWEHEAAQRNQQMQQQQMQRQQDRSWQVEDRDLKLKQPQYFMSGRDRVAFDPATGQSNVIYDGPEDYQNYAEAIGAEPDSEGYTSAVQDFVLRGNGPTSQAARAALEATRNQNRMVLRGMPTYAQTHPRPSSGGGRGGGARPMTMAGVVAPLIQKVASGQQLTPAEQQAYSMYARRGAGRGMGGGQGGGTPAGASGPPVGTVQGGYRFKGGNPKDRANWIKQ